MSRLKAYLEEATAADIEIENLMAGGVVEQEGKLAFHVLHQPDDTLAVMQDEIFGLCCLF
ncbi:hypothetical protein [Marinomonas sp. GJ51-6]|uniref:hypothetical protein n=1 Tax=Marinomonas sp. GJ51-6 TaxID=2992802 RepID=UPI00293482D3|nr:hypothetical protein [Marinomonas sp. GJ51-6]WOD09014.1 hypothetical protein ONZ50_08295 [Marinomonas sp. GJ51-6]